MLARELRRGGTGAGERRADARPSKMLLPRVISAPGFSRGPAPPAADEWRSSRVVSAPSSQALGQLLVPPMMPRRASSYAEPTRLAPLDRTHTSDRAGESAFRAEPAARSLPRVANGLRSALGELQLPSRLPVRMARDRPLVSRIRVPAPSLSPVRHPISPLKRTRAQRGSPRTPEDDLQPSARPSVAPTAARVPTRAVGSQLGGVRAASVARALPEAAAHATGAEDALASLLAAPPSTPSLVLRNARAACADLAEAKPTPEPALEPVALPMSAPLPRPATDAATAAETAEELPPCASPRPALRRRRQPRAGLRAAVVAPALGAISASALVPSVRYIAKQGERAPATCDSPTAAARAEPSAAPPSARGWALAALTERAGDCASTSGPPLQPFSPPIVPLCARRFSSSASDAATAAAQDKGHATDVAVDVASASAGAIPAPTAAVQLRYDATLHCYFDPKTGKYYEMR